MGNIAQQLLLQVLLILLNSFFAATEIAVISLNENKVRKLAETGDKKAKRMLKMVEEPNGFLSTIQVGITLAGFLGSAFAADTFSDRLVDWLIQIKGWDISPTALNALSVIVITIILSYFTLVLGELVPKRIAMRNPDKLARAVCGVISVLSVGLKPIIWLLSKSTNVVLRLFRINPNDVGEDVTEEDIMVMIDAAEEKGGIDSEARDMIENVFDFDDLPVADIMVHRTDMTVIRDTDSKEEIIKIIEESGFSRIPVCSGSIDNIVGILRAREYYINLYKNEDINIKNIMQEAFFVPESIRANRLLQEMRKNKSHMSIVVDEFGGTAGLITMEDLIEAIVGEIYDETDKEEPLDIIKIAEDTWRIYGDVLVDDVIEETGISIPAEDEEYNTLGGFIVSYLSYIPQDGEKPQFEYEGFFIKVEEVSNKRIERAIVRKLKKEPLEKNED